MGLQLLDLATGCFIWQQGTLAFQMRSFAFRNATVGVLVKTLLPARLRRIVTTRAGVHTCGTRPELDASSNCSRPSRLLRLGTHAAAGLHPGCGGHPHDGLISTMKCGICKFQSLLRIKIAAHHKNHNHDNTSGSSAHGLLRVSFGRGMTPVVPARWREVEGRSWIVGETVNVLIGAPLHVVVGGVNPRISPVITRNLPTGASSSSVSWSATSSICFECCVE